MVMITVMTMTLSSNLKHQRRKKGPKSAGGKCKACGSTTHQRSNHSKCPYNKRRKDGTPAPQHEDDLVSENSDVMTFTDDILSDAEDFSSEDSEAMSNSEWCFEDDISTDMCICRAGGRAHKKDCPMSSSNRYPSCILFPKVPPGDSLPAHTNSTCKPLLTLLWLRQDQLNLGRDTRERKYREIDLLPRSTSLVPPHLMLGTTSVYMTTNWLSTMSLAVWYK